MLNAEIYSISFVVIVVHVLFRGTTFQKQRKTIQLLFSFYSNWNFRQHQFRLSCERFYFFVSYLEICRANFVYLVLFNARFYAHYKQVDMHSDYVNEQKKRDHRKETSLETTAEDNLQKNKKID